MWVVALHPRTMSWAMRLGCRKITRKMVHFAVSRSPRVIFAPTERFFNGRFIIGNDYVRMYVTLVGSSWVVVASVLTGVDFITLQFADSRVALHSG